MRPIDELEDLDSADPVQAQEAIDEAMVSRQARFSGAPV